MEGFFVQAQSKTKPNRLVNEKSPYLLQHAYNPVDWYPWSQEAFDRAKAEDKPLFVSIGYSTCHWCHVMEKESFEDEEVAALLNDAFICIKVDREERPDLDSYYMAACQAMGRSCGWPLNVILTPKMNPFFATSYIPKNSVRGLVGLMELVPQVKQLWKRQRQELEITGADIKGRVEAMEKRIAEKELGREILQDAFDRLKVEFDAANGGFGRAPKFPRPHSLMFLLRYWKRTGDKKAIEMVELTLKKMRQGGICDQLGFGFHRYSTDVVWLVPHFEKMLYDQALMALAFLETFQATAMPRYEGAAKEILTYVQRELASLQGAFFSAQDADSEGEEGKFYVWTMDEVLDVLSPADADLAVHVFGLKAEGNFTEAGKPSGKNILHFDEPLQELAPYKGMTLQEMISRVHEVRDKLFQARKKRVAPATDDKVLTDWNGLMIAAFARAGRLLSEAAYVDASRKAADFFLSQMLEGEVLFHRYSKGERAVEGFLDDYAFLGFGLTELYEASFDERYLRAAVAVTDGMVRRFWDEKNGGFFFTAKLVEARMPRIKQVYDGALPSGNSVAMLNLVRLAQLANNQGYENLARKVSLIFSDEVQAAPDAYTFLLSALDFALGPSHSVTLVGEPQEKDIQSMIAALNQHYLPNLTVSVVAPNPSTLGYQKLEGKATAYVCQDQMCLPATNSHTKMLEFLGLSPEGNR